MRLKPSPSVLVTGIAAALLALAGCNGAEPQPPPELEAEPVDKPDLGLFTTLPVYWHETADLDEMLAEQRDPPWPRAVLEESFDIVPLDSLAGAEGLRGIDALLLAQPRALSPQENVALDDWVRAGGQLLLFADPLLTAHSRFAIGDRRRPQDVVLLSPILARWGLALEFVEGQPEGERLIELGGTPVPVNLPGRLRAQEGAADCKIEAGGLLADCRIGAGRAVIFADAALFEEGGHDHGADRADHAEHGDLSEREAALRRFAAELVERVGDSRGAPDSEAGQGGDDTGERVE